jgi:hypothetical protein
MVVWISRRFPTLEEMRQLHFVGLYTHTNQNLYSQCVRSLEYGFLLEMLDAKLLAVQEAKKHTVLPEQPDHPCVNELGAGVAAHPL